MPHPCVCFIQRPICFIALSPQFKCGRTIPGLVYNRALCFVHTLSLGITTCLWTLHHIVSYSTHTLMYVSPPVHSTHVHVLLTTMLCLTYIYEESAPSGVPGLWPINLFWNKFFGIMWSLNRCFRWKLNMFFDDQFTVGAFFISPIDREKVIGGWLMKSINQTWIEHT